MKVQSPKIDTAEEEGGGEGANKEGESGVERRQI